AKSTGGIGLRSAIKVIQALRYFNRTKTCDVIVITRGGGSMEDLWCFNDERRARDIVACPIPIVSGIGHEVDFTIADFVADLRAATPTAAAEKTTSDQAQLMQNIASYK
ncbi:MAG: exodeoxyribonuclease VII large subunit, partial [Gammaproteobacteria bacterium]